ncbi:MAG: chemotaxis protein CheR, partial [Deltaproteobacteria bacterium]|nr:chemotaxis protein CheR [Deltaproteobacteria bacterium]
REILSQIKRMVTFSYLNLASDPYPHTSTDTGSMDVILCRNVLMYFTSEHQQRAIKGFMESLVEGGWLIVSPAEASMVTEADLRPVNFPGAILFKKECKPVLTAKRADLLIQPPSVAVPAASNLDSAVVVRERTKVTKVDPARPSVSQLTPRTEEEPSCKGRSTPYMEALAIYERGLYLETVEKVLSIAEQDWLDGSERCAAFTLLSRAYANLGMLHEALKWSDQAVAFDKLNPWGHYFRGTILQECGEIQEAVRSMNRALFLDPKLVVAHFALGSLLRQVGTPRDSERHFKAALNILNSYRTDQEVAGCDGMTAGRLREIIAAMTQKEGRNA